MLLSAVMIAKNEAEMLKKTLPLLSSCVDELIFVDTGSSDGSIEVALANNARVFHFPWINDFSAARNESLKYARGEWVIWIDADEAVKPEEFAKLREFLKTARADYYSLKLNECDPDSYNGHSFYFRPKIFRNNRGIHFERPINEQPVDKDGQVITGDLISSASIYHWGRFRGEAVMEQKWVRNINLLKAALEKNPGDKHYLYLLANNYKFAKRYAEAIPVYQKAIESDSSNQFASLACVSMGWCYYNLKNPKEAYQAALKALELDPAEVGAYNILGAIAIGCGHSAEAVDLLKKADAIKATDDIEKASNITDTRYLANYFMGEAFLKLDQKQAARQAFEAACRLDQTEQVKQKLGELK